MSRPTLRETELGTERRCPRCGEFWPAQDADFWSPTMMRGRPSWASWCRACQAEYKVEYRARRRPREAL